MHMDAVIGCDAIDAGPDWLRLKTAAGAVRTVPWASVELAGFAGPSQSISIEGVSEKTAAYAATHDSLWIAYAEGFAQAMIEKDKRDALVATLADRLGPRWRGDQVTGDDLMKNMMPSVIRPTGLPMVVKVMMFVMAALLIAAVAAGYVVSHH